MNANGYRFDGVVTDPIEGWAPESPAAGRVDPPAMMHLQIRYTAHELMLVYLTNTETVSDNQWQALTKWIDQQKVPVVVFGQFDASRLQHPNLITIDAQRLVVSKSLETWQFSIEELTSPLGSESHPYMIRCKELQAVEK